MITYSPPPTVERFLQCDDFVRVIVGPVGSGKSSGCVSEILKRAANQKPDKKGVRRSRFAVVRNTYRELHDTTAKTFDQWLGTFGHWKQQEFTFQIDRPLGDGTRIHCEVLFRALDSPGDVKKLLSLELTGAYVNEARELPKEVFDGLTMRVGRYPSKGEVDGGASWYGVWADTNPWATSSWGYQLMSKEKPEGFALFEQPDGLGPDAENVENLPGGYYARMCAGKDAAWIDEYVRGKYPSADKGSVYGDLLDALERRGGVTDFLHPSDGVHAVFDLGVSDATAIWWFRFNEHGAPDVIDWYEATGQGASHYFDILRAKPWKLDKIWLPHDARARSFQTNVSTLELFSEAFGRSVVQIGPELSLEDGIGAGRWQLEQPMRFHSERCADGLSRLRAYRYVWDEAKKVFSKKPLHDFSSHSADAWRYLSQVSRAIRLKTKPPEPKKPIVVEPKAWSLDELFAATESNQDGQL